MSAPNGWHIERNPKPLPTRAHDWDYWHDSVDIDNHLCGTAGSREEAIDLITEIEAETMKKAEAAWNNQVSHIRELQAKLDRVCGPATALCKATHDTSDHPVLWADLEDALHEAGYGEFW